MKLLVCENYEEASVTAAKYLIDLIKEKNDAILGLATGSSPIGMYKELIKSCQNKEISFKNIKTYNLDEYCGIEQSNEQSYFSFMNENLFNHVDINKANVNIPFANEGSLQEDCDKYNNMLNNVSIDLQVLGIGANGHIGFNEPNTSFDQETFIVELTKETIEANARFFNSIEEVPTHAITMGIKNILNAKQIVLIASGKSKAQAIYDLFNSKKDIKNPQTSLQDHSNVIVVVDKEAASLL